MSARLLTALASAGVVLLSQGVVRAAGFDPAGHLVFDPDAVVAQSFEDSGSTAEGGTFQVSCSKTCQWETRGGNPGEELALEGKRYVHITALRDPFDVELPLPALDGSYRFRVWVRHGRASARAVFEYTSQERDSEVGYMFPTGRVTSDGWVELESNPVSVTGSELSRAYLRLDGTDADVDAIEVVPGGDYDPGSACLGAFDPVCGAGSVCISERCRQGARYVPPLPPVAYRSSVIDYMIGRVQHFFGGHYSRTHYLPVALAEMDKMRTATTPWSFWNEYFQGMRMLHDWHTNTSSAIGIHRSPRRLGVCFVEGQGDLTQSTWPTAPGHEDVLVAYTGPDNTMGLHPGDRLVAVDGQNPIEWARSLTRVNWGYHAADDPHVDADFVEAMRDLITSYARDFSVIRCDSSSTSCSDTIETILVTDVPVGGSVAYCDNRPGYHLENPPSQQTITMHYAGFSDWRDKVVDSQPGEDIYGITWDSLYGPQVDTFLQESIDFFRKNARGVILDHRAGNGGTIDAPEKLTELVRTPFDLSVGPTFMSVADYDGPDTQAEGLQLFNTGNGSVYHVGSNNPDLKLPVALIIDRDGSASDWLPHGMKGAPDVRIFGPHQTAGAFSSFYQFQYWSRLSFQLASGDTVDYQGNALLGHGIHPDVIVDHTQTALMQGKDLPYEAALAWVRGHLK